MSQIIKDIELNKDAYSVNEVAEIMSLTTNRTHILIKKNNIRTNQIPNPNTYYPCQYKLEIPKIELKKLIAIRNNNPGVLTKINVFETGKRDD